MAYFDVNCDNYLKRCDRPSQSHLFPNKCIKECSSRTLALCIYCGNVTKAKKTNPMGRVHPADSWSDINTVFIPIPLCEKCLNEGHCEHQFVLKLQCSWLFMNSEHWLKLLLVYSECDLLFSKCSQWLRSILQRWSSVSHLLRLSLTIGKKKKKKKKGASPPRKSAK